MNRPLKREGDSETAFQRGTHMLFALALITPSIFQKSSYYDHGMNDLVIHLQIVAHHRHRWNGRGERKSFRKQLFTFVINMRARDDADLRGL